ncbi:MAG: alpha/beta fold hydrolase [Candidatus Sericytochromatia bacterium]
MKLFYRKLGIGKPIIIIHGLFGSSDNWLSISKKLSDKYTIYLPDIRNHGQSPHSSEHSYDLMVLDLLELIKDNNIEKPVIIGHSMGGKISMNFAIDYPEIVDKIIVVDIAPKMYQHENRQYIESLLAMDLEKINTRDDAEKMLIEKIPERAVRLFLLKNLYRKEDMSFGWKLNLDAIYNNIRELEGYTTDSCSKIEALFIQGELSKYILDSDYPIIKKVFPNSKIIKINGAGHWIHAEKPNEVYDLIIKFLSSYT